MNTYSGHKCKTEKKFDPIESWLFLMVTTHDLPNNLRCMLVIGLNDPHAIKQTLRGVQPAMTKLLGWQRVPVENEMYSASSSDWNICEAVEADFQQYKSNVGMTRTVNDNAVRNSRGVPLSDVNCQRRLRDQISSCIYVSCSFVLFVFFSTFFCRDYFTLARRCWPWSWIQYYSWSPCHHCQE